MTNPAMSIGLMSDPRWEPIAAADAVDAGRTKGKRVRKPASGKALKRAVAPRKQYGVLPIRLRGGFASVMLVTSRGTRRWIIPKGNPEKGKSGPEVGAMEAFEEAGLLGEVWNEPIGAYLSLKHLPSGRTVPCTIQVYRMDVERVVDDWPEQGQRERAWYPLDEAAMLVGEGGLVALLLKINAQLIGR